MTVADPFTVEKQVQRGSCTFCGYETVLRWNGTPGFHFEQRVKGFDLDGKPKTRAGETRCAGSNRLAEPLVTEQEGAAA